MEDSKKTDFMQSVEDAAVLVLFRDELEVVDILKILNNLTTFVIDKIIEDRPEDEK
jgi:hypothetical protein